MKVRRVNGGFSLIELIVGVAIMAVIVAPLLHAFVTSAQISAKSKRMHDATMAAQNLVEVTSGSSVDMALTGIPFSGMGSFQVYRLNGTVFETAVDSGVAGVHYLGLTNVASGTSRFDAMITLDTRGIAANDKPIARYTPMDGVYIQPQEDERNPDLLAATDFADQATILSGEDMRSADFLYDMSRVIEITVDRDEVQHLIAVSTRYTYRADYTYFNDLGERQNVSLTTADFETNFFSAIEDGTEDPLQSIYFFYFPCYSNNEAIAIYNWDNIAFDLFLVKQKSPRLNPTQLQTKEDNYRPGLRLYESGSGPSEQPFISLYTNLAINLVSHIKISPDIPYRVYKGPYRYYYGTFSDQLVATEPLERLYQISVDLYRPGENFASEAHVLHFDATKTD